MVAAALGVTETLCTTGRSAADKRLWDLIRTLKDCKTATLMARRIFEIGMMHGQNVAVRTLVESDKNRDSYAMFCKRCGVRWRDHKSDGTCAVSASVVPDDIAALANG